MSPDPEIIVTAMSEDVDITLEAVDSHGVSEQENILVRSQGSAAPFVPSSVPDSASNSHSPKYVSSSTSSRTMLLKITEQIIYIYISFT